MLECKTVLHVCGSMGEFEKNDQTKIRKLFNLICNFWLILYLYMYRKKEKKMESHRGTVKNIKVIDGNRSGEFIAVITYESKY